MLSAGVVLFDSSTMAVWSLLVFQSYMDITERQVFSVVTYFMTAVQAVHCIVYCLICTPVLPAKHIAVFDNFNYRHVSNRGLCGRGCGNFPDDNAAFIQQGHKTGCLYDSTDFFSSCNFCCLYRIR